MFALEVVKPEERTGLVRHSEIEEILIVVTLRAVAGTDVVGIRQGPRAAALRDIRGSQRPTPGKVRNGGQTMPVAHPQSCESGMIVSVSQTGHHVSGGHLILAEHCIRQ